MAKQPVATGCFAAPARLSVPCTFWKSARWYRFEPLLGDVDTSDKGSVLPPLDPAELDTVVVPAQEEGFKETALGENRWHHIRMSAAMLPQIKYLATYQVAPISAITHWAEVQKIQPWNNTAKYEVIFKGAMHEFLKPVHRHLAELKGLCESLPNRGILLDTLGIQEAKDSSEIENILTTHDELFAQDAASASPAAKEVRNYVSALRVGSEAVRASGLIRLETVLAVQAELEQNRAGLRTLPGTVLKSETTGNVIYEPPQDGAVVASLMGNLIDFIHADDGLDPLLRMAIAHHQFESIHPFYDGNGRTGRILNLLMLQRDGLLDLPVLYFSRYITTTKRDYYRLLQTVREEERWGEWCLYMLRGIAVTSRSAIATVRSFRDLMLRTKHDLRERLPKLYSQDLLNNLFRYPYTKIEFVERELQVSRITAMKYLDQLTKAGIVRKQKLGRTNFYINEPLYALLSGVTLEEP